MNLPDHGEYSRYARHACRCEPCRGAGRRYRLRLGYDRVNGTPRRIDPTQTRHHAERLIARGWTQTQIAAAAGLRGTSVSDVMTGRWTTVSSRTAAAILGIELTQKPPIPKRIIDAIGTRRRLQALMVLGHSMAAVAAQARVGTSTLQQIADGQWDSVRTTTAVKVARAYRRLSLAPALRTLHSELVRNHAMEHGWHGPMAWDDIDNPACKPDPDEPAAPRHVHPDDVADLARLGLDDREIGRRLGLSPRTVLRARSAHNIPAGVAA